MHSIFFYMWLMKRYRISARHFRQNRHFSKGPIAISIAFFHTLAILAINRHLIVPKYAIFAKIATFSKGPFAISFAFLFIIWRFLRLIPISVIFANYAIFAKIATLQRAPLPSHLYFCLQLIDRDFGD